LGLEIDILFVFLVITSINKKNPPWLETMMGYY